ncbi:MAG TPA: DUF3604 domain-containing protein [Burkholderiaceae bacterium]|nr:DUF3604 domain-containing protein [Burkholderiaceae bacterium]
MGLIRLSVTAGVIAVASIVPVLAQAPAPRAAAQNDEVPARGVVIEDHGDPIRMRVAEPTPQAKAYSPYAGRKYPTRVLWGDTHVHTSNSPDAFAGGNRFTPEETFRIARGAEVISATGLPAKLARPLDFIVISDHSEALGLMRQVYEGHPAFAADPTLQRWGRMMKAGGTEARDAMVEMISGQSSGKLPTAITDPKSIGPIMKSVWEQYTATADKYNEPGRFTTIIGYEWTPQPGGDNLHRNVLFRDGKGRADQVLPFSSWNSDDPEKLWAWMESYEQKTGGRILAIPHNANLSNGRMFETKTFTGAPLTRDYAERRRRWEPIHELVQIKGASESHPLMAPTDEFIGYGIAGWDLGNLTLEGKPLSKDMMPTNYVREGLKRGIEQQGAIGVNPFKFGVIGSSDVHNSIPSVQEDNFFGKFPSQEPSPGRWEEVSTLGQSKERRYTWQDLAAGYAAVWATDNTREAIWEAFMRKETYATSGTRMTVRFFGGWDYTAADAKSRSLADTGYAKGVPMGGDLSAMPAGKSPTFIVAALKDPTGANLDRIQIIKGWVDASGKAQEKIYDVVWSGNRKPGKDGKLPPVGDTVDVAAATWTNTIGATELAAVWKDPDFKVNQRAFYYARVIEIPTPRWTAYDQVRFGVKMGKDVPMTVQERAWTSSIWYTPG